MIKIKSSRHILPPDDQVEAFLGLGRRLDAEEGSPGAKKTLQMMMRIIALMVMVTMLMMV